MDKTLKEIISPINNSQLSNKWLLGIVFFGIGVYVTSLKAEIEELNSKLQECIEERGSAQNNVVVLTDAIMRQNDIIQENNKKFVMINDGRDRLAQQLSDQQVETNKVVKKILSEKVPQTCEEARTYLIGVGQELKWGDIK